MCGTEEAVSGPCGVKLVTCHPFHFAANNLQHTTAPGTIVYNIQCSRCYSIQHTVYQVSVSIIYSGPGTMVYNMFYDLQSVTTLWKGINSSFLVKGIQVATESAISEFTTLPK